MSLKDFKSVFKSDESRFILFTAFKVVGVFIGLTLLMAYLMWIVLSINNVFFEANGYFVLQEFRQAYFDYILSTTLNYLVYYFILVIVLFFIGAYLGILLLRPFQIIGEYCLKKTNGENPIYYPDLFSDYKLLTRFSEYFFEYLNQCEKKKELTTSTIPPVFQKIKKPTFEKVFFFHFMLFILMIMIISSLAVIITTSEIQSSILELAMETLKTSSDKSIVYFLRNQSYIFDSFMWVVNSMIIIVYTALGFHLYEKVSGAIFAFFATMRTIMKGNYTSRIHLVGYKHIRPSSRAFNKYLDKVERECKKINNKM